MRPPNLSSVSAHGCSGKAHRMTAPLLVRGAAPESFSAAGLVGLCRRSGQLTSSKKAGTSGGTRAAKLARAAHARKPRPQRMMDDWISASEPAPHEAGSRTRDATKRVDRGELRDHRSSPTFTPSNRSLRHPQHDHSNHHRNQRQLHQLAPAPFKTTRTCNSVADVYQYTLCPL